MADLRTNFIGIKSPNPFWLASAPPTDKEYNVVRAFKAGWGGVVWKTLGEDPPVVNVSSRYGALHSADQRMIGFNNIELITDRPFEVNLREIKQVKRDWPDRAVVVSLMVPCTEESWKAILPYVEETGADGIELNFGCPHGMSERGMGSAVGQVPEICRHGREVVQTAHPHAGNCEADAQRDRRAQAGPRRQGERRRRGVADQHHQFHHPPSTSTSWPRCRRWMARAPMAAIAARRLKPIAMHMVADIARDPATYGLPISAIGGISNWRDAAEFMSLSAGTVQVCTAAMHYGFRIVDDMISGLSNWMDGKGYKTIEDFRGKAVPNVTDWQFLNINYKSIALIDQDKCIKCGLCHIACEDTSHQSIAALRVDGKRRYEVIEEECVGCNLCAHVCPVPDCISMVSVDTGKPYLNWTQDPRNPMRKAAE